MVASAQSHWINVSDVFLEEDRCKHGLASIVLDICTFTQCKANNDPDAPAQTQSTTMRYAAIVVGVQLAYHGQAEIRCME